MPLPGRAYWNQRQVLLEARPRIEALVETIGENTDLTPFQWAQLLAYTLEFKPDLILELGRGAGNSTCVFTERPPTGCYRQNAMWSVCACRRAGP